MTHPSSRQLADQAMPNVLAACNRFGRWTRRMGVACVLLGVAASTVWAQLTPEHRKQLNALTNEIAKVGTQIRKKELADAKATLDEAEKTLKEISEASGLAPDDKAFRAARTAFEKQRAALERAQMIANPEAFKVDFLEEVAPIITARCLRCHGAENPRAGLRLDSFAGWRRGGRSGPLLAPGNPQRSMLLARLTAPAEQRMPPQGDPLEQEQIQTIAKWVQQGAKYDGTNEAASLADQIYEAEKVRLDVKIPTPKGTETVKFTRDIAPWFSNLCLNCHNANRQSGGLSVETFYDIMKGGESGAVILPGDMDNSRLFRLVGGLELPRMPQGQARITRKNYEDLKTWFKEGNAFDGADPRTPIRTYVDSPEQNAADRFRSMTAEQFKQHREQRSREQWKRALPSDEPQVIAHDQFFLMGNVGESDLQSISKWAESHLATLQKALNAPGAVWRGGLAVFIMKDRFGYDEFSDVIEQRRAEAEETGHARITANQEDAYVVLCRDEHSDDAKLKSRLMEQMAAAFLQREGVKLPAWLVQGASVTMALSAVPDKQAERDLEKLAGQVAGLVTQPADVFRDGEFSPATVGAVGYTLVSYLRERGGAARFAAFLTALGQGQPQDQALETAFGAAPDALGRGYLSTLRKR